MTATAPTDNPLDALFVRLQQHDKLGDAERAALSAALGPVETLPKGADLVREGDNPGSSTLLLEGLACRYRTLSDGRRQIVALHLPGDFVDLHAFVLKEMDHAVGAITTCRIARAPHPALERITEDHPHLTRLLWLLTLIDAAIMREWAVGLGRRTAVEHMAHLLCELDLRLRAIGQQHDDRLYFPVTQSDLGDMLGISPVHTNRVLQELRSRQLIHWEGDFIELLDRKALAEMADFGDLYLHLVRRPR